MTCDEFEKTLLDFSGRQCNTMEFPNFNLSQSLSTVSKAGSSETKRIRASVRSPHSRKILEDRHYFPNTRQLKFAGKWVRASSFSSLGAEARTMGGIFRSNNGPCGWRQRWRVHKVLHWFRFLGESWTVLFGDWFNEVIASKIDRSCSTSCYSYTFRTFTWCPSRQMMYVSSNETLISGNSVGLIQPRRGLCWVAPVLPLDACEDFLHWRLSHSRRIGTTVFWDR